MTARTETEIRQAERVAQSKRERTAAAPATATPAYGTSNRAAAATKGDRWRAYNAFVDVISPRMTLAERAVWHVMFRHARGWVCETTVRNVAHSAAVSRSTAEAAMHRLVTSGLVWAIWKSSDKSKPSKYGIHPNPEACLAKVIEGNEPSRSSGQLPA